MKKTMLKVLSTLLCLVITASALFTANAASGVPGDINRDGSTNNKDVVALFRYLNGSVDKSMVDVKAVDTTGDGNVDNKDVVLLFRHVSDPQKVKIFYGTSSTTPKTDTAETVNYTVRSAEWVNIEWEQYSSPYFTLSIPKGWKVQWNGDANALEWLASTEDFTVGIYNLDHGYAAKDPRAASFLGFKVSSSSGTVQDYFKQLYADTTEYFDVKNSRVPDNIALIQAARPYTAIHDYQSLYAQFKDSNVEGEGLYSAVVMESNDVWVNGMNYGAWEINCILTQWAPQGEFVNWAPVLAKIAQSFAYTQYYLQQWMYIAQSATEPQNSISDTDPVMEAFEERSRSDTIIQEKRSDMIGEYERVVDNTTGNIYRAYNGFLDDIGTEQKRYTPITEDQYADGYVGWIEK